MGLFEAALKVVVGIQQSPDSAEKHYYLLFFWARHLSETGKIAGQRQCSEAFWILVKACLTIWTHWWTGQTSLFCGGLFRHRSSQPYDWIFDVLPKRRVENVCVATQWVFTCLRAAVTHSWCFLHLFYWWSKTTKGGLNFWSKSDETRWGVKDGHLHTCPSCSNPEYQHNICFSA